MSEQHADCQLCRVAGGEDEPADGWILRTDLVTAYVSGSLDTTPAWCQLQINRHVPTMAELTPDEAAAIGVAMQQLAAAGLVATGIDGQKVYMYSMCEFTPHFHLVLGPAPVTEPGVARGGALLTRLLARDAELADPAAAPQVLARLRAELPTNRAKTIR